MSKAKTAAPAAGNSGRGNARSAITGRYVKLSTAARKPDTTVVEKRTK